MKAARILILASLATAACVPRAQPVQQPISLPPRQAPTPPLPAPARQPTTQDWRDLSPTQGHWNYQADGDTSHADFGPGNGEAAFIVRCNRAGRQIELKRQGMPNATTMVVQTSSATRTLPVRIGYEPSAHALASIPANDPILDAMAYSRGHFTIETPGLLMLVIPPWPEAARVIEDCRR